MLGSQLNGSIFKALTPTKITNERKQNWRDRSVVKSAYCPHKEPRLGS